MQLYSELFICYTADAGVVLSVIIHMYKDKNTQNKPGGDDNDSAESSA